jgi:hypothetical protein
MSNHKFRCSRWQKGWGGSGGGRRKGTSLPNCQPEEGGVKVTVDGAREGAIVEPLGTLGVELLDIIQSAKKFPKRCFSVADKER